MKHPSSLAFFAYWNAQRGDARAPERSEIEPGAVRELLGDIFVLSYDNDAGYPFRVAGTRVSALLCKISRCTFRTDKRLRWWVRPARARARPRNSCCASSNPIAARSRSTAFHSMRSI